MARMKIKGLDEYAVRISKLANSEEVTKKAIYAGAKIVADEAKSNLKKVLSGDSSGDLLDSFGISPISRDKNGDFNAKIGFDGYDSHGTPNQLKARALESGTSTQKKRPFMRPAINKTKKAAVQAMSDVIDEEAKKQGL